MYTCRVDERNTTHADDAQLGFVLDVHHHFVELGSYTEEERTVDFVHLYFVRYIQLLMYCSFGTLSYVEVVASNRDVDTLRHTTQEENYSQ